LIIDENGRPLGFFEPVDGEGYQPDIKHQSDLTVNPSLDRINYDIALLQGVGESEPVAVNQSVLPPNQPLIDETEEDKEEERYYIEPLP